MPRIFVVVLLGGVSLGLVATATGNAWGQTMDPKGVTAPANVWFLDQRNRVIDRARATSTVRFVIRFVVPRSFPTGYTDVRFEVVVHGHPQRTLIYGTPKRVHPRQVLQVRIESRVSRTWLGTVKVVGTVRLLTKPGGAATGYQGSGSASLTVTR